MYSQHNEFNLTLPSLGSSLGRVRLTRTSDFGLSDASTNSAEITRRVDLLLARRGRVS